jgi:hypothetical protein
MWSSSFAFLRYEHRRMKPFDKLPASLDKKAIASPDRNVREEAAASAQPFNPCLGSLRAVVCLLARLAARESLDLLCMVDTVEKARETREDPAWRHRNPPHERGIGPDALPSSRSSEAGG